MRKIEVDHYRFFGNYSIKLKSFRDIDLDIYIVGEKLILRVRFRCFINLF